MNVNIRPAADIQAATDAAFEEHRAHVSALLPEAEIERVGATSIPGALTKGDLDLLVRVEAAEFEAATAALLGAYSIHQPENWTPTYASFKDRHAADPPVGVQLAVRGSADDALFGPFREALMRDPALLAEYNALKLRYDGADYDTYTDAKGEFVERVLAAAEWSLSQRFDTGTGEIAWDRLGDGPPVVLVHGTPWSSWTWRRIARRLAERFTVYVFDLLGFGASDMRPDQDVSLAAHGRRFADLLDFWGLERPAVVAHDIGGAVALRAHLVHERPVHTLALVDVVALRPWGSPFFRLVWEHHQVFEQLPPAIHEGLVRAYIGTAQPGPMSHDVENALVRPWLSASGQPAFYRQMAHADERHTKEIEPLLGRIEVPTLVVWGGRDPWIPVDRGRELARRIPGARLQVMPEAGHLVQEDEPDELARLLDEWVVAHVAAGG